MSFIISTKLIDNPSEELNGSISIKFNNIELLKGIHKNTLPVLSNKLLGDFFSRNLIYILTEEFIEEPSIDWIEKHKLSFIGNGYCWPDMMFFRAGNHINIVMKASEEHTFTYIHTTSVLVSINEFKISINKYLQEVDNYFKCLGYKE